jgi:Cytochrome c, mono- and diheme variants
VSPAARGRAASAALALAAAGLLSSCGGAPSPADPSTVRAGAQVFSQAGCGTCHTLGAAGSRGTIGPSLDVRRPPVDRVASQVEEGGGAMPAYADRLSDEEIDAVAAYVAEVAGR